VSVSELEQLLADLVRVPSPSGAEGPAADQAASWLSERGVAVERVGDSVVARVGGASGGPLLLLNTHLDTVGAGEGWTVDPLAGCWEGDRLVGLGANDAKGSAAAMMWATAHLAGASADLPGTLVLALNACEETTNAGMADVLAYLGESHGPPDAAVTGEPTGLEVVRAQAGLAILELSWEGRACHAAHVARVDHANALLAAARDLAALPEPWVLEGVHPLLGQSTMAVTVLQAGERHNQIPDRARAVVDARLAPPHDAAECVALLEAALPGAQVGVRSERLVPVETPADHPLVTVALECAGREGASGSSTLSDMALLAGVPAVKCGPGLTARSHAPDEFLTRTELDQGAAFYERLVPAALVALATAEVGR
jgi:acetylornithine deacetylase